MTRGDAIAVGILALAQFLPFTLFGLFAGVIADRFDAQRLVIRTQAAQLSLACALVAISVAGVAEPWMLYTIAFLNGLILVLDVPSRQQLTYRMVGRDALPNAIALNSSLFNASRIVGPSLAGVVLGLAGVGVCFVVNAASFLAVLLGLLAMRASEFFPVEEFERPPILAGTREGLSYVRRQPRLLLVLALTVLLSTFCFNFDVTLPVLTYNTLRADADVFGTLSACFGAGALVGALASASFSRASTRPMIVGSLCFAGGELILAPARSAFVAGALLFVIGAAFTVWTANANAWMQLAAPDRLRGRIIGLYFYAFNGAAPVGGLLIGWLCATGGTQLAFVVAGSVGLVGTAIVAHLLRGTRELGTRRQPRRGHGCGRRPAVDHQAR